MPQRPSRVAQRLTMCPHVSHCNPTPPPPIADWSAVDPDQYLAPFLEVIRSAEVSGPVTGVALAGLYKIITADVIGARISRLEGSCGWGMG